MQDVAKTNETASDGTTAATILMIYEYVKDAAARRNTMYLHNIIHEVSHRKRPEQTALLKFKKVYT